MNCILRLNWIWKRLWMIKYLPQTIYFNFHYLPFKQAIKLPIILYKPKFRRSKGKVVIDSSNIKTGMVILGYKDVAIYPNNGITFEINGKLVFRGTCRIGNDSYISIGKNGIVDLDNNFIATAAIKLVCYHKVIFDKDCLIGWNCLFFDDDFHKIEVEDHKDIKNNTIKIGEGNWFGCNCIIMKGTKTPNNISVAANSMLNKTIINVPEYSVIANKREISIIETGKRTDNTTEL